MWTMWKIILFVSAVLQLFPFGSSKSCKIVGKLVRVRESFAFSGDLVRHETTQISYQECDHNLPNCCGNDGCCDKRQWKLFIVVFVGVLAGLLLLSFLGALGYSAIFSKKKEDKEEPLLRLPRNLEPRFSTKTYLKHAGFEPPEVVPQKRQVRRPMVRPPPPRPVPQKPESSDESADEED